jgi:hypothetical protein
MSVIDATQYSSEFAKSVANEYNRLVSLIKSIDVGDRYIRNIVGINGKTSITDIVSYQIGYGKLIICFYKIGLKDKKLTLGEVMSKCGLEKWDYNGMAKLFYKKYRFSNSDEQLRQFRKTVMMILKIIKKEENNLMKTGVWGWTTLGSGKKWSLQKWIQVNTVAPYRRAIKMIKLSFY